MALVQARRGRAQPGAVGTEEEYPGEEFGSQPQSDLAMAPVQGCGSRVAPGTGGPEGQVRTRTFPRRGQCRRSLSGVT